MRGHHLTPAMLASILASVTLPTQAANLPFGKKINLAIPACIERSDALAVASYAAEHGGDGVSPFGQKVSEGVCGFVDSTKYGKETAEIMSHLVTFQDKDMGEMMVVEFRITLMNGNTRTYTGFLRRADLTSEVET